MLEVQESGGRATFVTLTDLERTIVVDLKELRKVCKLRHAWARTIHTFQVRCETFGDRSFGLTRLTSPAERAMSAAGVHSVQLRHLCCWRHGSVVYHVKSQDYSDVSAQNTTKAHYAQAKKS